MIIQILHNKRSNQESRIKVFLSFFLILYSLFIYSQDSIPAAVGVIEKNDIQFQDNFFKALSQKAVYNYKKAIEYLENCNELVPNNKAVLFELSKNYLKLGRSNESLEYIHLALLKEPNNLWMLEHKVTILRRLANFNDAIVTQEKIAEKHPKKKQLLVFLHLQNRDIPAAKIVLSELKGDRLLNARLRRIEEKLYETEVKKIKKKTENTDLRATFEKQKTYSSLQLLLNDLTASNHVDLLKYSEQGLTLFPAQPFVYLMNGKALNNTKKYKKALQSLQNGIDFVIDNNEIEAKFYTEMARAYQKLNNPKKADLFKSKAKQILK
ncbi:hypothetical protein H0I31_05235 [Tenacibaculum sp. AHE15PA]|uniref:tetratricopeptide repeat protein n=1 Tax=unclassified Tenacibaculum TaxID=2635139 RepID=UPI001C4E60CE|nr:MULTISPECIES: hypothetical protein [unclassified Tenacibaculum]QXP73102.1 hypothetical protein H0I30_10495 [Tenacibaculum sp. AHE14PA]QXP77016.1 hypothetical protein H0I31_05235 [Tenacibaculum sp. AHE15PA]